MDFSEARVCLFDPARHNLMVTRTALNEIGFTNIDLITNFNKFSEAVARQTYDLIIAESHDAGGGVADLMRKLRTGEIGSNPFVVTVTTSWEADSSHVKGLVDAGIDDILLRPFSTENLRSRIGTLTRARKDFVVTSDYVGPDRRKDTSRASNIETFTPPNTLKATAEKDMAALQQVEDQIRHAKVEVARERIRRLAMKIVVSMQVKIEDPEAGQKIDMEDVDGVARELRRRLRGEGIPDALELATALTEITTDLLDPENEDVDQWKLVRELAMGAFMAYAGGEEMDKDSGEIKRTVQSVRQKLQSKVTSGWHSA